MRCHQQHTPMNMLDHQNIVITSDQHMVNDSEFPMKVIISKTTATLYLTQERSED